AVHRWVGQLQALSANWPPDVQRRLQDLVRSAGGSNLSELVGPLAVLRNVLSPTAAFQKSYDALHGTKELAAPPLVHFLRLPWPRSTPAAPDTGLAFTAEPLGSTRVTWARALMLAPALAPMPPPSTGSAASP